MIVFIAVFFILILFTFIVSIMDKANPKKEQEIFPFIFDEEEDDYEI